MAKSKPTSESTNKFQQAVDQLVPPLEQLAKASEMFRRTMLEAIGATKLSFHGLTHAISLGVTSFRHFLTAIQAANVAFQFAKVQVTAFARTMQFAFRAWRQSTGQLLGYLRSSFGVMGQMAKFGGMAVGKGLASLGIAFVTGGIAVAAAGAVFVAAIGAMATAAVIFAGALDPNLAEQFSISLRDLNATFGVAFQPLLAYLVHLTRQISGALLPALEEWRGPLLALGRGLGDLLLPIIHTLAGALAPFAPILEFVGGAFSLIGAVLDPIAALIELTGEGLAFLLKPLSYVGKGLIILGDAIRKGFGWLFKVLGINPNRVTNPEGGAKAGVGVKQGDLQSLIRDINLSAAKAVGSATPEERRAEEQLQLQRRQTQIQQQILEEERRRNGAAAVRPHGIPRTA